MKTIIFGVFAHPDDEAFYPAGTFLKAHKDGAELHMITLTAGSAGQNPDKLENLGKTRLEEWRKAGKLMGVTAQYHLGYADSQLNNEAMQSASDEIESIIGEVLSKNDKQARVDVYCYDFNGLSGHIDHIVASRAAAKAFYELKADDKRMRHLKLFCFSKVLQPKASTEWLYMDAGHPKNTLHETIDGRTYKDQIETIIDAHHTQREDAAALRKRHGDLLYVAHLRVLS